MASQMIEEEVLAEARKRVEVKKRFLNGLVAYVVVNIRLEDNELTISFPYENFARWIEYLPARAEYYRKYRQVIAYRQYQPPVPSKEIMTLFFDDDDPPKQQGSFCPCS